MEIDSSSELSGQGIVKVGQTTPANTTINGVIKASTFILQAQYVKIGNESLISVDGGSVYKGPCLGKSGPMYASGGSYGGSGGGHSSVELGIPYGSALSPTRSGCSGAPRTICMFVNYFDMIIIYLVLFIHLLIIVL